MFDIVDIILSIAADLCSWRVWLCIITAAALVGWLHYQYPEHDGFWSVSYPAAFLIVAFGFWWEHRVNR